MLKIASNYVVYARLFNAVKLTQIKPAGNLICSRFIDTKPLGNGSKRKNRFKNDRQTNVIPEPDLVPNLIDDPDTFGTMTISERVFDKKQNDEEADFTPTNRLTTKQYAEIIKKHVRDGKIKHAIDVLEVRMLERDRVKPESYIYSLVIGACGRVGYTKKAFHLFNDMKKRGIKPHAGAYTALFNACANSPLDDGLKRATKLYELMREKGVEPNDTNYNAMIKAFGRCGDIQMAFGLVDQMATKRIAITTATINFLLQACVENRTNGFRCALLVWRKMIEMSLAPNVHTFNLMLRATRDCAMSDSGAETLQTIIDSYATYVTGVAGKRALIASDNLQTPDGVVVDDPVEYQKPNLLSKQPHLGHLVAINEIKTPQDRLLLLGGMHGFLDEMKSHDVPPDIKTFTQLLDVIPETITAENRLVNELKRHNVQPDIDFFNMLIKRRAMRFDYENARDVLHLIKHARLRMDLITYGVLAIGCRSRAEARDLLTRMNARGYRVNAEILGAMLQQACFRNNFKYVIELMRIATEEGVVVNETFVRHLEKFRGKMRELAFRKDKFVESSHYKEWYPKFKQFHATWTNDMNVQKETHPCQQYRETTTNENAVKDKAVRFKPRLASRFKVKTSTKLRY